MGQEDTKMVVGAAMELAIMGLQIWLQASQMANASQAEKDRIYAEQLAKFNLNKPENLPEV